ncbi:MAG: glycosyltransferase family 2 protein [bacterium]|nr:glycosyltransferase family 2 protein [bacterium]
MFKISIIIPSYNTSGLTLKCLKRVFSVFAKISMEVIVIDNASSDNSVWAIKKHFPQVKIIANPENRGFARAVNQGIRIARGEYVLLLNTDAFVNQSLLPALNFLDSHKKAATLTPRLVFSNGRLHANFGRYPSLFTEFLELTFAYKILPWGRVIMPNLWTRKKFYRTQKVKWLSGACLFIRHSALKKIGLFDEKYFMYLEDIDFGKRVCKAGLENIFFAQSEIIHYHHGSSRGSIKPWIYSRNSLLYFWQKYYPKRVFSFYIIKLLSWIKLSIVVARSEA